MAKKSAIFGEYIVQVEDNNHVDVFKIYDNVKGSLRQASDEVGFHYEASWNTRNFGSKLINEFGEGNSAQVGNYFITKRDNGSIETYRSFDNTKEALREIANAIGFDFDPKWTTQQFGNKLVDFKILGISPKMIEEEETSCDSMGTESNNAELRLKSYMSEDSQKFGFKNEDTDEMVIPCVYDAVGEFGNNGLAPIFWVDSDYILHLEAFIDLNGDVQMYFSNAENSYNMGGVCGGASTFQNGFSLIQDIDGLTILSINGDKKLVNIPELEEEVNFEFMNNELEDFNASFDENGNIIIVTMDELYGVLNSDGELIIPCDYAELSRTETGFSACKEWGDEDKILFDIHGNQLN